MTMKLRSEPTIHDLPDDILCNILLRVKERKHFTLVCRKWFELHRLLTTELSVGPCVVTSERDLPLLRLSSRYINLTKLKIFSESAEMRMQQMAQGSPTMKVDDKSLSYILLGCVHLTDLSLEKCDNVTDAGIAMIAECSRFTAIDLCLMRRVSAKGINALVCGCRSLRSLHLDNIDLSGGLEWLEIISVHHQIESLKIQHCGVTESDILKLGSRGWKKLREFRFIPPNYARPLLWKYSCWEGTGFCPQLEVLSVSNWRSKTTTGLLWILAQCKSLRTVDLLSCDHIRDEDIHLLVTNNPHLSSLALVMSTKSSAKLTNASLTDIAKNCPYLDDFRLGTYGAPDETRFLESGIVAIVESCTQLGTLSLQGTSFLGNGAMAAIGRSPSLQAVDFFKCMNLNDEMIRQIGPNLRKLQLMACPKLTDKCLSRFRNRDRVLENLNVFCCKSITLKAAKDAAVEVEWWNSWNSTPNYTSLGM